MTCRQVDEFLMDYLEGKLPTEAAGHFGAHLAECEDCRLFISQYQQTIRLGGEAFRFTDRATRLPDDLVQAILRARKAGENG